MEVEDTITLKALYTIFHKMKAVDYNASVEIRDGFVADPEMIYNSLQKELNAQARIVMN